MQGVQETAEVQGNVRDRSGVRGTGGERECWELGWAGGKTVQAAAEWSIRALTMGGGLKQQIAVICALCVYRMDARLCDIGRHAGQCGRGYCASALHRLLSGRSEVAIPLAEPTRPVGEAQE